MYSHTHKKASIRLMDVLINSMGQRILSQCIHMLNHHHIVHFKSSHFIYINYTLIKLEKKNDRNARKINNRTLEPTNVPDVEDQRGQISKFRPKKLAISRKILREAINDEFWS